MKRQNNLSVLQVNKLMCKITCFNRELQLFSLKLENQFYEFKPNKRSEKTSNNTDPNDKIG